jgi:hypothetical protein
MHQILQKFLCRFKKVTIEREFEIYISTPHVVRSSSRIPHVIRENFGQSFKIKGQFSTDRRVAIAEVKKRVLKGLPRPRVDRRDESVISADKDKFYDLTIIELNAPEPVQIGISIEERKRRLSI